jgi:Rrf2 family protein
MAANSRFAIAVHALTVLGYFGKDYITSDVVASSVNTHPVLIRRILGQLKKAGLVESQSGTQGGLRLAVSPEKITLHDVYRGIQSERFVAIHSNPENKKCPVSRKIKPVLEGIFQNTELAIDTSLKSRTLADLIDSIGKGETV